MRSWFNRLRRPRYDWWVIANQPVEGYGDHDQFTRWVPFRSEGEAAAWIAGTFGEVDPDWDFTLRVVRTLRGEWPRLRQDRMESSSGGPVDLFFRGGGVPNARSLAILRLAQETRDRRR